MQNREHFIKEFFDGDLTQEDAVKAFIKEKVTTLTAQRFEKLYLAAQAAYVLGQPFKMVYTYGMSIPFKGLKSIWRHPQNVNDANVHEKIKELLLGTGNSDRDSFKYHFVEELILCRGLENYICHATSDRQAANLIEMVLEALGHKPHLSIARPFSP